MKNYRNWIYPIAGVIVAALLIVVLLFLLDWDHSEIPTSDSEIETTAEPLHSEPNTESTEKSQEPTESTESTEPQRNPIHLEDFDEGNEIYLDMDVISTLADMESEGEEDLVCAILEGEIKVINRFVRMGYSHRAVCQAQRFYYDFYDVVGEMAIDAFVEKLSACMPIEGAVLDGFAGKVQNAFDWGWNMDFSYVIDVEVTA